MVPVLAEGAGEGAAVVGDFALAATLDELVAEEPVSDVLQVGVEANGAVWFDVRAGGLQGEVVLRQRKVVELKHWLVLHQVGRALRLLQFGDGVVEEGEHDGLLG